jgi:uncharacterized protein (DUF433 family)
MTHNTKPVLAGTGSNGEPLIRKTPGVCGGDACIRRTRIAVWLLVSLKKQGVSEPEFLAAYPGLSNQDLEAAWEYYRLHPQEIEEAIASQQADDAS